jgi:hypothetical protein
MGATFTAVLMVEIAVTVAMVAMLLWRGFLDMKEEDHIVLDDAESHLQRDQAAIRQRLNVLSKYLKVGAVAWGLLAMVLAGVYVVDQLNLI